jgi:glycolate oxidase
VESSLKAALQAIYPPEQLLFSAAQLAPYESDALTAFQATPAAVVLPETAEQVVRTVQICYRDKIPFVARGSGTSLSGGSLPIEGGVVIGLNRLTRILSLDPQERIAVVEPGVINWAVTTAAAPHGLYYAPDPSSQQICTVGGNVAFNSGGAHCLKHGMTSNHVLGLKAVLADGEVVDLGGRSLENTGPDFTGLFVGSEGLFGIALEITLRLVRRPERYRTLLASYPSLAAAGDAVSRVIAEGFLPGAIEIMDRLAIQAAEAAVHAGYPPQAEAVLIVELEGETVEVEPEFERLTEVVRKSGAGELRVAQNDDERARIWKGRKSAFSAVGRLSSDFIVQDGVVPRSRLGDALSRIRAMSAESGIRVANVFHAGDGNLHPLILFDGREKGALGRAEQLASQILAMCIELGGSITGEHGVGMEKREHLEKMFQPADMRVMYELRRAMDPAQLANRGKMLFYPGPPESTEPQAERLPRSVSGDGLVYKVESPEHLQQLIAESPSALTLRGAGTKPALSGSGSEIRSGSSQRVSVLDLAGVSGVIEYDPSEFTITALAGTRVAEVEQLLARNGQFLPFDPVLSAAGATLGGTVAAAGRGPSSLRYGGIRDFLIGVRFVDGQGRLIRGGGKVVKNAAGFDFPKLMVGSAGCLAALVELTFKVFPRPENYVTLVVETGALSDSLDLISRLQAMPVEFEAIDLIPPGRLLLRLGGCSSTLKKRAERVMVLLGANCSEAVDAIWPEAREFRWVPNGAGLAKIPTTLSQIPKLEEHVSADTVRRYSLAGSVCWLAGNPEPDTGGIPYFGRFRQLRLTNAFARRVKSVLDPKGNLLCL